MIKEQLVNVSDSEGRDVEDERIICKELNDKFKSILTVEATITPTPVR